METQKRHHFQWNHPIGTIGSFSKESTRRAGLWSAAGLLQGDFSMFFVALSGFVWKEML